MHPVQKKNEKKRTKISTKTDLPFSYLHYTILNDIRGKKQTIVPIHNTFLYISFHFSLLFLWKLIDGSSFRLFSLSSFPFCLSCFSFIIPDYSNSTLWIFIQKKIKKKKKNEKRNLAFFYATVYQLQQWMRTEQSE